MRTAISRLIIQVFLISVLGLTAEGASARTWYVAADGSGDAPTIAAAVDSTVSGDVILVGPGTHLVVKDPPGSGVLLKAGTTLISQSGPLATFLKPGNQPYQPTLIGLQNGCVLSGFTLRSGDLSAIHFFADNIEISYNIVDGGASGSVGISCDGSGSIHHNLCYGGFVGVNLGYSAGLQLVNNIVLNGIKSAVGEQCLPNVFEFCNLINGAQTCLLGEGNFSADPLFCGVGNYYIREDSPCAPGNHPDGYNYCGQIGPLPVGCGTVKTKSATWGEVKAMYRN